MQAKNTCARAMARPRALDERVLQLAQKIEQPARQNPVAVRLQLMRCIGQMALTAVLATAGNASQSAKGGRWLFCLCSRPTKQLGRKAAFARH